MIEAKDELQISNELIKALKPKLFLPVWTTVICSGPPLNLIVDLFLIGEVKNLTITIIMTVIALTWSTLNWYWYIKEKKKFKKLVKEIPKVTHYLFSQEKSSLEGELIKLTDIVNIMPREEILKKIKDILDNIKR